MHGRDDDPVLGYFVLGVVSAYLSAFAGSFCAGRGELIHVIRYEIFGGELAWYGCVFSVSLPELFRLYLFPEIIVLLELICPWRMRIESISFPTTSMKAPKHSSTRLRKLPYLSRHTSYYLRSSSTPASAHCSARTTP